MFNLKKFLAAMKKAGWTQIAVSNNFPRTTKPDELSVTPKSDSDWTFYFRK